MKKLLAAVTAILMLSALTACGNDGNSAEVTDETTSSAAQKEISAVTKTESSNETETETETEAETEASEVDDKDIHSGNGYTAKVDSAKWMDASEYVKMRSEYAEVTNLTSLRAEDTQNMNEGMFYRANDDGTHFNIVCNPVGNTDGISIGDGAELMKEQYVAMGINWLGSEVVEINGLEWLKIDVETSMSGVDMKMRQCMALANGNQYVLTYTADSDKYSDGISDFEEVVDSFKLAE